MTVNRNKYLRINYTTLEELIWRFSNKWYCYARQKDIYTFQIFLNNDSGGYLHCSNEESLCLKALILEKFLVHTHCVEGRYIFVPSKSIIKLQSKQEAFNLIHRVKNIKGKTWLQIVYSHKY